MNDLRQRTEDCVFNLRDLLRKGHSIELIKTELRNRIDEWNMSDREDTKEKDYVIRDVALKLYDVLSL